MIHSLQKRWVFTWYAYGEGKKLPSKLTLIKFFDYTCDYVCFQKEKGSKANKLHW